MGFARDENPTVYSTEKGRICPKCGQPVAGCTCHKTRTHPAGDGVVRVRKEVKGRGGKAVSVISGLALDDEGLKALAADLKRQCGTGGAVKDGLIEIQGDHRDRLVELLAKQGIHAKKAGG